MQAPPRHHADRSGEESRQREETARLEAIRQAEVEKARLDAENRARMDAMRQQQEHERHIAAIKEGSGKKKIVIISSIGGVFLVMALVIGGLAAKNASDKSKAELAAKEQQLTEQQAALSKLQKQAQEQEAAVAGLEGEVQNAKDEKARQAAQEALQRAREQQKATQRQIQQRRSTTPGPGGGPPRPACNCTPGDPLCSCL